MCSDLLSHLLAVRDPRAERNKLYPLQEILLLCICAVLSGAEGWQAIVEFGRAKLPWLRGFLPFANGIPSPDCLGWVFARLPAKGFQECFLAWTRSVAQLSDGEVIAIDGKRLRGSHDGRRGQAALHLVSAWASANRMCFGQVSTQVKSNEITAIPELLKLLELKGCIVTIDAVGCQSAIAGQILAQGGDYVLAVKDNQPELHAAVADYFELARAQNFAAVALSTDEEVDADHGRTEVRRAWLVRDLRTLPEPQRWPGLRGIALIEAERHQGGRMTCESRYYITSLAGDARQLAQAVRAHWGIENSLHWVLDVTFREDDSRIRRDHAPANFSTLRHFALNLIKRHPSPKSVRQKRFKAALDDDFRANVVFGQG